MTRTPGIRRYIFNTLMVVSLLLMLATVGLWVHGFWVSVEWSSTSYKMRATSFDFEMVVVSSCCGRIEFAKHESKNNRIGLRPRFVSMWPPGNDLVYRDGSFEPVLPLEISIGGGFEYLRISHLLLALVFAVGPVIWLIKWRRRRAVHFSVCGDCGEDLMGADLAAKVAAKSEGKSAPKLAECPQCGTAVNRGALIVRILGWVFEIAAGISAFVFLFLVLLYATIKLFIDEGSSGSQSGGIMVNLVIIFFVFTILPGIWFMEKRWSKRRLAMLGKCPKCAYDLTGNTTERCPECGTKTKLKFAEVKAN